MPLRILAGVALAATSAAVACQPASTAPCGGFCGPGTECVDDRCVQAAPAAPEPDPAPSKAKKGKRGKRRGTADPAASAADADEGSEPPPSSDEPLPPFVPVDDSKIPAFSNADPQVLDLKAGSERLDERTLDQHFARVSPAIQTCVTTASRYGEVGSGNLAFKLRLLPTGKVESVSVTAPASLRVWSIPACARKAVYQHRFPTFDGPAMAVTFSVDID